MVGMQIDEPPGRPVETLHAPVERRDEQPAAAVVPQHLDHIRRQSATLLLGIVFEAVFAAVPAGDSPPLGSDPQIALRILLETADDRMAETSRHRLETVVHVAVRKGRIG